MCCSKYKVEEAQSKKGKDRKRSALIITDGGFGAGFAGYLLWFTDFLNVSLYVGSIECENDAYCTKSKVR